MISTQPRGGIAWDTAQNGKSVLRASGGLFYARQNMLTEVGAVTTNGVQQKTDYRDSTFTSFADMPAWPNLLAPSAVPPGTHVIDPAHGVRRGDEIGMFHLGSTAVVLFEPGPVLTRPAGVVRMGQSLVSSS